MRYDIKLEDGAIAPNISERAYGVIQAIVPRLAVGISATFVVAMSVAWWMLLLQGVTWLISN